MRLFMKRRGISAPVLVILLGAVLIVGGLVVMYFSGYSPVSGREVTEQKDFSDFTIVKVGTAFQVKIIQSDSYSVSITANENVMDNIEVSKTGEALTIRVIPGNTLQMTTLIAEITMPDLQELELSGAVHGTVEGFSSTHLLAFSISGASSLDLADMSAGDVEVTVSGASNVEGGLLAGGDAQFTVSGASSLELDGEANDLTVDECSGASDLDLSNFPVNNAGVDLSGASRATVNLDGTLDADISGASRLEYIGAPTMGDVNISGGSSINKK